MLVIAKSKLTQVISLSIDSSFSYSTSLRLHKAVCSVCVDRYSLDRTHIVLDIPGANLFNCLQPQHCLFPYVH